MIYRGVHTGNLFWNVLKLIIRKSEIEAVHSVYLCLVNL